MEKKNNSFSLIKMIKTIFKADESSKKKTPPKRTPNWMYRNE